MSNLDLDAIENSLKGVTPGPWYVWDYNAIGMGEPTALATVPQPSKSEIEAEKICPSNVEVLGSSEWLRISAADLNFIVTARSALPNLLQEVRRLRGRYEK